MRRLGGRGGVLAFAVALAAAVRAVVGHLALPLLLVVRGVPFLGLLVVRPNEAALAIGAAQIRDGVLAWPAVVAAGTVGALAADVVSYALGRVWGEPAVERLRRQSRHRLVARLTERAHRAVGRGGAVAVLLSRPTIVTHGAIPVLAGAAAMPIRTFLPAAAAGAVVWAAAWTAGATVAVSLVGGRVVVTTLVAVAVVVTVGLIACRRLSRCGLAVNTPPG